MEITADQLDKIWTNHSTFRTTADRRKAYYDGEHDITKRTSDDKYADGNEMGKLVTNLIDYAIDLYVGALTSTPYQLSRQLQRPSQIPEGEEAPRLATVTVGPEKYYEIADQNKLPALDAQNLLNALLYGVGVELHEFNEGAIHVTAHDPREWALVRDETDALKVALRRVTLPEWSVYDGEILEASLEIMTVYTEDEIVDYKKDAKATGWEEVDRRSHNYGRPPVVVWQVNEGRVSHVTDSVLGQQDELNDIDTISGDDIRNVTNAKLTLIGCDPDWLNTNAPKIQKLNQLPLPENSKAEYLVKPNDVERLESRIRRTRQTIHEQLKVPDMEEIVGSTGATSGIALRLKFLPMIQESARMRNYLEAGVRERVALFNSILGAASTERIENFTVNIQFTLPTNQQEEWQSIPNLKGIVSHRKQLEFLTGVDDPDAELEALKREALSNLGAEEASNAQLGAISGELTGLATQAMQAVADGALDALLESGALDRVAAARAIEAA